MSHYTEGLTNHHLRITGDDTTVTLAGAAEQTTIALGETLAAGAVTATTVAATGAVSGLNLAATTAAATALPVIHVTQTDVSEEFIRFTGTSADTNSNSIADAANLATPGAIVGWLKIYVEDLKASGAVTDGLYWVPFYATPTA